MTATAAYGKKGGGGGERTHKSLFDSELSIAISSCVGSSASLLLLVLLR